MSLILSLVACVIAALLTFLILRFGFWLQTKISFLHDPVYVPSKDEAITKMFRLAKLRKNDVVIDLGSGDGRVLVEAAQQGCKGIGYEIDPFLVLQSRWQVKRLGLQKQITIYWQSFWSADVSKADVVLIYATASIMERLEKKLRSELPKGARVVTQRFPFPHWKYAKKIDDCYLHIQEK